MRFALAALVAASLVGVAEAAPATASSEVARQLSTAQLRVAEVETQLVQTEVQLKQLQEWVSNQGRSEADRLENLDQVNAEVARLRGSMEVLQFQLTELQQAMEDQQLSLEKRQLYDEMRLTQIEKFLAVQPPPPPTAADLGLAADGAQPADVAPGDIPADADGKLELAISHMEAGRQAVARAILTAAVEAHTGSPEMAEIRYRLAETWFNEKKWAPAVSGFNKVINNHAGSEWACWSYYRQGEAFEAMGKPDGAKAFFAGATEGSCRNSDAAAKAKLAPAAAAELDPAADHGALAALRARTAFLRGAHLGARTPGGRLRLGAPRRRRRRGRGIVAALLEPERHLARRGVPLQAGAELGAFLALEAIEQL
jgi:TolA-binding protein